MSMTMDLAVDGRAGSFTADGAFDFSGRSGTLRMDLSSMGLPGVRGAIDVRLVDGVLYMDMGSLVADASPAEREALGGKRWVKLDLSQLGGAAGANGFGGLGSSDPTSALDSLRGAGSDVHEVGHETLRGVDTTHYRAQIDLSKALDEVPPSQRARVSKSLQALGTGTVPADVWIDGQGRVRKLAMDLNASVGRQHVGTITMELFDFGTPVDVQAPPADQTFDLQSLLGGAVGGMLGSRSSGVVSS